MMRAFYARDAAAEGIFLVGVRTTGIFCRPTCGARKPKPENIEFYVDASAALHDGFRPCKLCKPLNATPNIPSLVEQLRDAVEADPTGRITDKELSDRGIDPSTARRQFQRYYGMTFQAYTRARRMGLALREVGDGGTVTEAQFAQGFESASGFREAVKRLFGAAPRDAAKAGRLLYAERINTPLGRMLAVADDAGLHILDFVDRRGLERKLITLRQRLKVTVIPGTHPVLTAAASQISEYFAGRRVTFDLPLVPLGTEFENAAWRHLRSIPPGTTQSYSDMAAALGRPGASRAVGRANGMNFLSIIIPCHRVIAANGDLTGYGGGLWRKQWLLNHESAVVPPTGTSERISPKGTKR
ncbi:methylated-DNA--[protein]-cysteine S-methyltransferase [Synoicihabitans lomoniglobus]|uniref:Methylated-DNA--protein-cysteine methyltransferase n=2 Tax=Synoicihabitans lomoniglobus TaxID=2909285 RepID=A0AAF0CQH3_9BACT|nr:methylated-DNA--[protein]-cysteine S-methyltransferase [Opitutaceae bacterium LMO-M01]